jgi:predicted Zn-dependent protease
VAVGACEGVTRYDLAENRLLAPFLVELRWDPQYSDEDVVNCLERITIHELGHTIGIFGHSPRDEDLMNASPRVRVPSSGDRATAEVLYHTPATIRPPPVPVEGP